VRCPACNMPMKPRERGGFACEPCRQLVTVYRVDRHQYLASIQEMALQQAWVAPDEALLSPADHHR